MSNASLTPLMMSATAADEALEEVLIPVSPEEVLKNEYSIYF